MEGKGGTILAIGTPEMRPMRLEAKENESKMEENIARARRRLLSQKEKVQKMKRYLLPTKGMKSQRRQTVGKGNFQRYTHIREDADGNKQHRNKNQFQLPCCW